MRTRTRRAPAATASRRREGPTPNGQHPSLEDTLDRWARDAEVLRRHGHTNDADLIERLAADVRASAAPFMDWVTELQAYLSSGRTPAWLRARFDGWQRLGLAEERDGVRRYRRVVLPLRPEEGD
jgi:hypothetical protein